MSAEAPVLVIGAGGHAKVIVGLAQVLGLEVACCVDDDPARIGGAVLGVPVRGPTGAVSLTGHRVVLGIGNNRTRARLASSLSCAWATLVHPRAFVHPSVTLGAGTVVFAGAVVQPEAVLGAHVIVNTGATVDHDCRVGDCAHLAPGVHLAGDVHIGDGAFLGVGVSVIPGRRVGAWATVGAGAAVVRDVAPGTVAMGVPARSRG